MRDKFKIFIMALFLTFVATCWVNTAFAQITPGEHPHPVFDGVERVFIYVHYVGPNEEGQQKLPAPLRQKNIEDLLLKIYKTRFSSKDCRKLLRYGKMHGCNDQPVEVKPYNHYWSSRFPDSMKPGTLNVVMKISLSYLGDKNLYQEYPQASFVVIQDRADPDFPTKHEINVPMSVPLQMSEEKILDKLERHIKGRIF